MTNDEITATFRGEVLSKRKDCLQFIVKCCYENILCENMFHLYVPFQLITHIFILQFNAEIR